MLEERQRRGGGGLGEAEEVLIGFVGETSSRRWTIRRPLHTEVPSIRKDGSGPGSCLLRSTDRGRKVQQPINEGALHHESQS